MASTVSKQQAISWGSESNKNGCSEKNSGETGQKGRKHIIENGTLMGWTESTENGSMWTTEFNTFFVQLSIFFFDTCRHAYHTDNLKHIFHTSSTPWTLNTAHIHTRTPHFGRRGKAFSESPIQQQQCNDNHKICTVNDEGNALVDIGLWWRCRFVNFDACKIIKINDGNGEPYQGDSKRIAKQENC